MNYCVVVHGELTVIDLKGNKKTIHEGEAVVETVNISIMVKTMVRKRLSSMSSTSRRRICSLLFSTQRFLWSETKSFL